MDQRKIGAFIAQLRREKEWTQEELGSRLGVTNKTVSRWENGNYMPDIEMLSLLGQTFHVSLNELVQGCRLEEDDTFRAAAEENLTSALERPGARFWNWLDRHMLSTIIILVLTLLLAAAVGLFLNYKAEHPADVLPPGSYVHITPAGRWDVHLVFDQEGNFWRYRQGEDFLEHGNYTWREDRITVTTDEGNVYQLLIKGNKLYERDSEGNLLSYRRFFDDPMFINCGPDAEPLNW